MISLTRRQFVKGLGAGTALVASGLPGLRVAFGGSENDDTLIVVFQRGACDGLQLVPPTGGNDRLYYELARPNLQIPLTGTGAALPLANSGAGWGLHPAATGLHNLYQSGHLALVLGAGMPPPVTRSHFDAQATMEMGTPGNKGTGSGWLTRHLNSMGLPGALAIPAVSATDMTSTSLIGSHHAITMADGEAFRIDASNGGWDEREEGYPAGFRGLYETLPDLWAGNSALDVAGRATLAALDVVRPMDFNGYAPANGASYPDNGWGEQLQMLAQLIKAGVGLRVAAVDLASWDHHDGESYLFPDMAGDLSAGLSALYTDLSGSGASNYIGKVTVLVMTEFGRRVDENDSGGTDHGYGSVMLALGGGVNGGQVYGLDTFAGLADDQLFHGEDVAVTTDFRRVLSEALIRRTGNNHLGVVFPGYTGYSPMGIFQGSDMPPDYSTGELIFANGFE